MGVFARAVGGADGGAVGGGVDGAAVGGGVDGGMGVAVAA